MLFELPCPPHAVGAHGRDVEIVGRLDEQDEAADEKKVLKKSRITFTFRDGTRYGRGAGERTAEPQPAN